ncbi:hypothetical protein HBI56_224040 [Parastagonospora nodorum]|uniref:Uncharacterized protein n=1 Tax=Phaeosphaeria nodorum (strain SN15 / ATCC MYA-4574 / FGSC 10173) TaxID=321614 RepID=A0A7U2HW15_PHANO|nr:hypothetical protein HBH56_146950 [Parastagonospora nodorum]QRC93990.1 hypothetical protein JI435_404930 [Parastagonospora nodorum SN15]KAH3923249.1 hypothetical protein HBH54_211590 [Parastagonospora nodorum]KAH3945866.1 hypothetical protein HBH53_134400 [Parastagonospora nodorum]KAH3984061.1 hypothetical protein HBH52_065630 [Parastagonospora nodorum]
MCRLVEFPRQASNKQPTRAAGCKRCGMAGQGRICRCRCRCRSTGNAVIRLARMTV